MSRESRKSEITIFCWLELLKLASASKQFQVSFKLKVTVVASFCFTARLEARKLCPRAGLLRSLLAIFTKNILKQSQILLSY
jgi:hypothetical protein